MPHDNSGRLIQKGDKVAIVFEVTDVQPGEDFCNCTLKSLIPMPPSNTSYATLVVNTKQVEKVNE